MVRVFVVVHFLSWFKYSRMKINQIWASQGHFVKSDMVVTLKVWPNLAIFTMKIQDGRQNPRWPPKKQKKSKQA